MTTSVLNPPMLRKFRIFEGTSPRIMSRVTDATGAYIATAAISSISYSVYTITSGVGQPVLKSGPTALTVGSVWYDTPQTDSGWQEDAVGYTFSTTLPASCFSGTGLQGKAFQIEIWATPVNGDRISVWRGVLDVVDALSVVS